LYNVLGPDESFSSSYPLPVSTPNTIHHSRLTVCLPNYLNMIQCQSIVSDKRLCISWYPLHRFCGRCMWKSRVYN